jgi:hypothetical protein
MNKAIAVFLLFLLPTAVFSQTGEIGVGGSVGAQHKYIQDLLYQKTTYTVSTLDTTTWFTVEPYRELALVVTSSDSAVLDFYIDGRNSFLPNTNVGSAVYADSLTLADSVSGGANSGERRYVLLKTTTLNRLLSPTINQIRLRVDHRTAGAGTTTGRTQKIYLVKTY